ncbi:DnaJ domain-containing protein [Phlyctema vagabunda]|uniref:DnaJ domain-containing protein n=1 Tax=Phlyctema vagabunda TaxID=108571 RepID=A0ABR4PH06_9HELO
MSSTMLTYIGWGVLPNMISGWVQALWYGITIRAGDPKPAPGSPKYVLHRRRIQIIVISAYLLYTIYEADWNIRKASDFYQDLGVAHSATEREIKSRFRRLAAIHHPDKVSSSSPSSEGYFVHLKLAQDTLLNPVKRFAYERFGPDMINWQNCSSIGDYVRQSFATILPSYSVAVLSMYLLGLLGYLNWGTYWRWLSVLIICVFELHTVTRPTFPALAANILNPLLTNLSNHPPYLPFQILKLARQVSITIFIACAQIGPLLQPLSAAPTTNDPDVALQQQLDRLGQMVTMGDVEASRLLAIELAPFAGEAEGMNLVTEKVKEWLVQNTIRNDPETRSIHPGSLISRLPGQSVRVPNCTLRERQRGFNTTPIRWHYPRPAPAGPLPPRRFFPDPGPSPSTVRLVVGSFVFASVAIWLLETQGLAKYGEKKWQRWDIPSKKSDSNWWNLQNTRDHLTCSLRNVREGRYYVLLTSSFMHHELWHLAGNMLGLWSIGKNVAFIGGIPNFLILYTGGAITCGLASVYGKALTEGHSVDRDSIGASGSVLSLVTAMACIMPRARVSMFFIRLPIMAGVLLTTGLSLYALKTGVLPEIDHAGHLGGIAFGALWWLVAMRSPLRRVHYY